MKWHTFHNCERLAAWCDQNSATFDAVSLDVFDTVLIRRVHNPDLLKLPVARFIAARADSAGHRWAAPVILRFRNRVEKYTVGKTVKLIPITKQVTPLS